MLDMVLLGVNFLMLFEVLRSFERLVAHFTDMWFEWGMHCKFADEDEVTRCQSETN